MFFNCILLDWLAKLYFLFSLFIYQKQCLYIRAQIEIAQRLCEISAQAIPA